MGSAERLPREERDRTPDPGAFPLPSPPGPRQIARGKGPRSGQGPLEALQVFPEGENRGRGARGMADIWGNARSPGRNASRATSDAVHSGPPPPRRAALAPAVHPPETLQCFLKSKHKT